MVSLSVQSSLARRPLYRDSAARFLTFLHGSVSPKPLIIPSGRFQIFSIRGYIRSSRCTTGVVDTGGKHLQSEKFLLFFLTPLGSRVSILINAFLQVHFKLSAVWYCSHCLPPVSLISVAFATIVVYTCFKFVASIVDTGGKFATGINNTSRTGAKIFCGCYWYRWCTLTCEYLCKGEDDSWKKSEAKYLVTLSL
jgi:hypothetical protein